MRSAPVSATRQMVLQDPAELVLTVSVTAPGPAAVVLARAETRVGGAAVRLQVIGASHQVAVEAADGTPLLHERLACGPVTAPDELHRHAFTDHRDHAAALPGYRVAVRFDDPGPLPPRRPGTSLEVAFPAVADGVPITRVEWWPTPTGLVWTTVHTYPGPGRTQIVTTRSALDLPQAASG